MSAVLLNVYFDKQLFENFKWDFGLGLKVG